MTWRRIASSVRRDFEAQGLQYEELARLFPEGTWLSGKSFSHHIVLRFCLGGNSGDHDV